MTLVLNMESEVNDLVLTMESMTSVLTPNHGKQCAGVVHPLAYGLLIIAFPTCRPARLPICNRGNKQGFWHQDAKGNWARSLSSATS